MALFSDYQDFAFHSMQDIIGDGRNVSDDGEKRDRTLIIEWQRSSLSLP